MEEYINTILCKDCIVGMKELPDESIHLVVTSPPYYNAKEYSKFRIYGEYLDFIELFAREVYRLLKEGRFCVINTSPIIEGRRRRNDQSKRYGIPFDIHP